MNGVFPGIFFKLFSRLNQTFFHQACMSHYWVDCWKYILIVVINLIIKYLVVKQFPKSWKSVLFISHVTDPSAQKESYPSFSSYLFTVMMTN